MAEKVSERLTEMGQDLTSMIEEINNVSATLSKTSKPDNPVSDWRSLIRSCVHSRTDSRCVC